MNHLFTLIVYDLRSQLRERGTLALLLVALALAGFGLLEGTRFDRHNRAAVQAAADQQDAARTAAKALALRYFAAPSAPEFAGLQWYRTAVDVRGYAFREHVDFAAKPALAGAALAVGQADLLPAYVRVRAESMDSVRAALEIEHPERLAAGRFELLFFIVYLWPLLLLALTTSVLSQERESHRLRALQLQGVRPGSLLAAQIGARTLAASALLVVACGVAALLAGALPATMAGLSALAAWAGVVLLYSLFWGCVAGVLCAVCGNRMTAAFAGFGAWLVLAIVLPGALAAGIALAAPPPARERYVMAMRDAGDAVNADKLGSLARFYDSHPDWRPAATPLDKVSASVARLQRAEELERVMAGVDGQFARARARQQQLHARWLGLSPVTLTAQVLARLAGNDDARHQLFLAAVQRHQQALRAFFQQAIQQAALGDERHPCASACIGGYGFRDFDAVPRFSAPPALSATPGATLAWRALPLWSALLAALAFVLLRLGARQSGGAR